MIEKEFDNKKAVTQWISTMPTPLKIVVRYYPQTTEVDWEMEFEDMPKITKRIVPTFNEFREKREEQVYSRIHAVAEKIRLEKGLDVLLDQRGVFSGGIDITDALILKLNQNK